MNRWWKKLLDVNVERSIWIDPQELGAEKTLEHNHKKYSVKIPKTINKMITLRLKGMGKRWGKRTGDLFLHVWLNRGEDVWKSLWLSEQSAINGDKKIILLADKKIQLVIPKNSYHGLVIRLKGLGGKAEIKLRDPALVLHRGDLLVKLFVYPTTIVPVYGSFDLLDTDEMALEGWVYRKIDEIRDKVGRKAFQANPITADKIADLFNSCGWTAIYDALVDYLGISRGNISLLPADKMDRPGSCQRAATVQNGTIIGSTYTIRINAKFLDNPFTVAAILAHELCHIVYAEKFQSKSASFPLGSETNPISLEEERMVDLLVFLFNIGEYQLRVSRDERLTLGYFNQKIFDRMQVIVSRWKNNP
jgi:hypothetical protein